MTKSNRFSTLAKELGKHDGRKPRHSTNGMKRIAKTDERKINVLRIAVEMAKKKDAPIQ
jgi:hypothetical protein